ncbi:MAG: NAD(+) diphosphatase, partial [Eubacterium sp.]
MIQDIEPYHLSNEYKPVPPNENATILWYKDNQILLKNTEDGIAFPKYSELSKEEVKALVYLFSIEDSTFYLADAPQNIFGE